MKDELFAELVESVHEGGRLLKEAHDLDVLGDTLDEFADQVPGLSTEDALEVLWAVARLADAIEGGKAGRNAGH